MSFDPNYIDWNDGQGYRKITNVRGGTTDYDQAQFLRWLTWTNDGTPQTNGGEQTYKSSSGAVYSYSNTDQPGDISFQAQSDIDKSANTGTPMFNKLFLNDNNEMRIASSWYNNTDPSQYCRGGPSGSNDGSDQTFCRMYSRHDNSGGNFGNDVYLEKPRVGQCTALDDNGKCVNDYQNNTFAYVKNGGTVPVYDGSNSNNPGSPSGAVCQSVYREGGIYNDQFKNLATGGYSPSTNCNTPNTKFYPIVPSNVNGSPKWNSMNPDTGELTFLDQKNIVNCCSLPLFNLDGSSIAASEYPQCLGDYAVFNPALKNNYCSDAVIDYCQNSWTSDNTGEIGSVCSNFLQNSPVAGNTTITMIQRYITDNDRNPHDYISPKLAVNQLAQGLTNTPAIIACYQHDAGGNMILDNTNNPMPYLDPDTGLPVCMNTDSKGNMSVRDDSTDPFFANIVPFSCNTISSHYTTTGGVSCDATLNEFCQQFSKDDIFGNGTVDDTWDNTLMNMCGCHLLINPSSAVPTGKGLLDLTAPAQTVSPYYGVTNGGAMAGIPGCDPACINASIQSYTNGECDQQQCIIDNITFDSVNSTIGPVTFNQNCTGGDCYIGDIDVDSYNSLMSGKYSFTQQCKNCYMIEGGSINNSKPIPCNNNNSGGGGGNNGGGSVTPPSTPSTDDKGVWGKIFSKKIVWAIVILLLIVIVLIGFAIYLSHKKKKSNVLLEDMGVPADYSDPNLY